MEARNQLYPSNISSGGANVTTYKRAGLDIPVSPIEEYVTLRVGAISANASQTIRMSEHQLTLRPIALWVMSDTVLGANDKITVTIKHNDVTEWIYSFDRVSLPYEFPPFILESNHDIVVTPNFALDGMVCILKQCAIIERIAY